MPDGTTDTAIRQHPATVRAAAIVHAGRRDQRTARLVYQAQALRRAFGRSAAYTFLLAKRVPAALSRRVLSLPDRQLRR